MISKVDTEKVINENETLTPVINEELVTITDREQEQLSVVANKEIAPLKIKILLTDKLQHIYDRVTESSQKVTTKDVRQILTNFKETLTSGTDEIIVSFQNISDNKNDESSDKKAKSAASVDLNTAISERNLAFSFDNLAQTLNENIIKTAVKTKNPHLNMDKIDCYLNNGKKEVIIFSNDTNVYHNSIIISYDIIHKLTLISNVNLALRKMVATKSGVLYAGGAIANFNNGIYCKKVNDNIFDKIASHDIKGDILSLAVDQEDNLWLGTHNGNYTGYLYKKNANSDQFHAIYSDHEVWALTVDNKNNIYFAYYRSFNRFIMQKDFNKPNFVRISQQQTWVASMVTDTNNDIYIGGQYSDRAIVMKKLSGVGKDFFEIDSTVIEGKNVINLTVDKKGTVYAISEIGAKQSKVYQKDINNRMFWEIANFEAKVNAIVTDDNNNVYLGVNTKLYHKTATDKVFREIADIGETIAVLMIAEDVLWVGTWLGNYKSRIYKTEILLVAK